MSPLSWPQAFLFELDGVLADTAGHTRIDRITPIDLRPGALGALLLARVAGCGVALASPRADAARVLARLGIAEAFDHVVDASRLPRGEPQRFLAAARALGALPVDCVGIVGTVAGIRAVRAAGMFTLCIGDAQLLAEADQVLLDLSAFVPSNYLRGDARLRWIAR